MSKVQDERSHRFSQLIGLELKASFARHETSQAEVAERLGHSKSGYSRWLNAKPSMPIEALMNTCELIGVDPRDVFNAAYRRLVEELGAYKPSIGESDSVQSAASGERVVDLGDLADRIASHPEEFDLMASTDRNKENEMNTPRE